MISIVEFMSYSIDTMFSKKYAIYTFTYDIMMVNFNLLYQKTDEREQEAINLTNIISLEWRYLDQSILLII